MLRTANYLISLLILASFLSACQGTAPAATATASPSPSLAPPMPTAMPPTTIPSPTATVTQISTLTPLPTETPTLTPTSSPSPTPSPTLTPTTSAPTGPQDTAAGSYILKYLILQNSGGPVACGDNLIGVSTGQVSTGKAKEDIKLALNSLFSTGVKYSGELYNPLFQSKLRVASVEFDGGQRDEVNIVLIGTFVKPKEACDKLRYRAQVWQTVRQFPGIRRANIRLDNGLLLGDLLAANDG